MSKMSFKYPFCSRSFSTRSAYSQHKNFCIPSNNDSSSSKESEELELKTNDHDIEVRNLQNFQIFLLMFSIILNLLKLIRWILKVYMKTLLMIKVWIQK